MTSELEEQKKAILPFMQRAQEIQQADPKVAYYCRMYAVEQAIKLPNRAKDITALLSATLNQLERDKAQLKLNTVADRIHCLGFALRVFDNADRVDRAGRATERTSHAFYAASVFIEILNQFEDGVDAELLEKQRYCAWRAAEIRKAIRKGLPIPPPPSATPTPQLPDGVAGGLTSDLPLASGSSNWAYSSRSQSLVLPPPMPPLSPLTDGSFNGTTESGLVRTFSGGGGSLHLLQPPSLPERAPPPSISSLSGQLNRAGVAPAEGAAESTSTYSGAARLWPGVKLLIRTEEGVEEGWEDRNIAGGEGGHPAGTKVGTIGQVIRLPDGSYSYKVALADRLVELPDKAAVPVLQEGGVACLLPPPPPPPTGQQHPSVVKVLLINYATWPPKYLIQLPDGKEHTVTAQDLAPPLREDNTAATAISPVLQQPSQPLPLAPPQASLPVAPSATVYSDFGSVAGAHTPPPPNVAGAGFQASYPSTAAATSAASAPYMAQPSTMYLPPGYKPPVQVIVDAQKQAKYAVSALSFEDIHTAVKHLSEAHRLLTSPPGNHQDPGRR